MIDPTHMLAQDDAFDAITRRLPMLDSREASALAEDIIAALEREGWIVEVSLCAHRTMTLAIECENPTRPGKPYCPEHEL